MGQANLHVVGNVYGCHGETVVQAVNCLGVLAALIVGEVAQCSEDCVIIRAKGQRVWF